MTNKELDQKLINIIKIESPTESMMALCALEKEYKQSDFYKATRTPLKELVFQTRLINFFGMSWVKPKVQELIDGLNYDSIDELIDKTTETFTKENRDIAANWNDLASFRKIVDKNN